MQKALAAAAAGIAVGGVAAWLLFPGDAVVDSGGAATPQMSAGANGALPPAPAGAAQPAVGAGSLVAELVPFAAVDDVGTAEAGLARAVAAAPSAERELAIEVLLARIAALDPARAMIAARMHGLGAASLERAYRLAAAADTDASLARLPGIEHAAARRSFALAFAAALGADDADVARVAAALPESERAVFAADAFALRSGDFEAAFAAVLALSDTHARGAAAAHVAAAWGRVDPARAIASAEQLPPDEAAAFRSAVSSEWARRDPEGFLEYFARGASAADTTGGVQWLLASDPEALVRIADRRTDGAGLRMAAFVTIAETDPLAAIARVEAMPPGQERESLIVMVALPYAMRDPDAALAWLDRVNVANPMARMAVATAIARNDLRAGWIAPVASAFARQDVDAALRWVAQFEREPGYADAYGRVATQVAQTDPPAAARLLAAVPDAEARAAGTVASLWARRDSAAATQWALGLARGPARDDALGAMLAASPEARDSAAVLAAFSSDAARQSAVARVIPAVARTDRDAALRLLEAHITDAALARQLNEQLAAIGAR